MSKELRQAKNKTTKHSLYAGPPEMSGSIAYLDKSALWMKSGDILITGRSKTNFLNKHTILSPKQAKTVLLSRMKKFFGFNKNTMLLIQHIFDTTNLNNNHVRLAPKDVQKVLSVAPATAYKCILALLNTHLIYRSEINTVYYLNKHFFNWNPQINFSYTYEVQDSIESTIAPEKDYKSLSPNVLTSDTNEGFKLVRSEEISSEE